MTSPTIPFTPFPILSFLSLPPDYHPSPEHHPIDFLSKHLYHLPPHLLPHFSIVTTPKQRTSIAGIRNRRLKYTLSDPPELAIGHARRTWGHLYPVIPSSSAGQGRPGQAQAPVERKGQAEGKEERLWAEKEFLGGKKQYIGKLGALLGDYEEEREAERMRGVRRMKAEEEEFVPEEDEESDEEGEGEKDEEVVEEPESVQELEAEFLRKIHERFIYGLLDSIDYDAVDWDDKWDEVQNDDEERWFDDEDPMTVDTDEPIAASTLKEDEYDY